MTALARRYGALAGVASAAVALGVAEVVAVLTGARSAPLIAVGGAVVDAVPGPLKQFAIDVFGRYDKIALLIGTAVLLGAFAAGIGVAARRSWWYAAAGIAVFAIIGGAAATSRPGAGAGAVLPSLLGALAGLGVLRLLLTRAVGGAAGAAAGGAPVAVATAGAADPTDVPAGAGRDHAGGRVERMDVGPRRRFLATVGLTVGAAALAGAGGRFLASRRSVDAAREAVRLPPAAEPAPSVPADAELAVPRLTPFVTGNDNFYRIDTALVTPQVDPAGWQLRIHGRVRNPMTLSFADLLARPMVERHITLACVSNEVGGDLIGNACWLGVRIKDLLDEAQPLDGADQVVGRSVDGWTCGTPTALLRDGRDALLAVGMNGQSLPIKHGFPVRMVVPGLYGYVSACKWIVELELTSFADFDAYWVPRGWSAQGPIKTQSRIDTPRAEGQLTSGPVTVAGVAWAQRRGVAGVQVSVDDGPWQAATLAGTVSVDTWRQWRWQWNATAGSHTLRVRATDATGQVQPEQRAPVEPDGATGWHTVRVEVA